MAGVDRYRRRRSRRSRATGKGALETPSEAGTAGDLASEMKKAVQEEEDCRSERAWAASQLASTQCWAHPGGRRVLQGEERRKELPTRQAGRPPEGAGTDSAEP